MAPDPIHIVFLPAPLSEPITGGEIYNNRLFDFLKSRFDSVTGIRERKKNTSTRTVIQYLRYTISCLIINFRYALKLMNLNREGQKIIIIEDIYSITDFFILNRIVKCRFKRIHIVPLIHHLMFPQYDGIVSKLTYFFEKQVVTNSKLIIVTSEETKMEVSNLQELQEMEKEILVATPGLGFKECRGLSTDIIDSSNINIVSVGTVSRRKDYETLIRAICELKTRELVYSIKVIIVGDRDKEKEYAQEMEKLAERLCISDVVRFVGRVSDQELCGILEHADIYVCTSTHEGFGMAIAEAMRFHLPIVASNAGAIPLLVQNGITGMLFSPKDPSDLSNKLAYLLKSSEIRNQMGEYGYARSLSFDWDVSFRKIEKALNNLADEGRLGD